MQQHRTAAMRFRAGLRRASLLSRLADLAKEFKSWLWGQNPTLLRPVGLV